MKNILFQILRILLFPLIWCHQVIMDAPVISCDTELLGFSDWAGHAPRGRSYAAPRSVRQHI